MNWLGGWVKRGGAILWGAGLVLGSASVACGGRASSSGSNSSAGSGPGSNAGASPSSVPTGESSSSPPTDTPPTPFSVPTATATPASDAGPPIGVGAPIDAGPPIDSGIPIDDAGSDQPWEVQQLARIRKGVIGTWSGEQQNPWTSPCLTTITFTGDGHYAAHSPGDACLVFYYGTNDDSPEKTYLIDDVTASAEGTGELEIYFAPGDVNRGQLEHIALSADANMLAFEAWKDGYGPMTFSLKRVSP